MGKPEGFIAAFIAVVGFGSNFIPCKRYDMGDGMFFNMIMCLGIWILGLIYEIIQFPTTSEFHPFALLGGLIWCTGNILSVPIIKMIGLALGIAIWGATALLVGWLTGKFGLFGTPKDDTIKNDVLNYCGVVTVLLAILMFMFVKPVRDDDDEQESLTINPNYNVMNNERFGPQGIESNSKSKQSSIQRVNGVMDDPPLLDVKDKNNKFNSSWVDNVSSRNKQYLGVLLSIIAGSCYGLCFCPIQYLIHNIHHTHNDKSKFSSNLEDYAFTHFSGILISSCGYFIIYCIYVRNKPQVNIQSILPSLCSGIVWGIAQVAFFTSDDQDNLGTDTSFPIVSSSPQIVASLWGVFLFKEIQGKKNLIKLCCAILVNILGVAFIALSKF